MIKLLIIEDNADHLEMAKNYIKEHEDETEIKLYSAKSLTEGKEYLENGDKINCVFLDLGLPDSDGINTVKEVINCISKQNKDIPVIVYTSVEDYSIAKEAFKLGIKGFIVKGEYDVKEIGRALNFASYKELMPEKQVI